MSGQLLVFKGFFCDQLFLCEQTSGHESLKITIYDYILSSCSIIRSVFLSFVTALFRLASQNQRRKACGEGAAQSFTTGKKSACSLLPAFVFLSRRNAVRARPRALPLLFMCRARYEVI